MEGGGEVDKTEEAHQRWFFPKRAHFTQLLHRRLPHKTGCSSILDEVHLKPNGNSGGTGQKTSRYKTTGNYFFS